MRLVHLTDLHLSSLDAFRLRDLRGKRRTGYWSWTRRRRHHHPREVLERLTDAVRAENADWLVVSGDLVQIGLESEIREAAEWLTTLAPAERILLVPGNHDVYARDSWPSIRRHWQDWLPHDAARPSSGYPLVRESGGLLLVGASSACVTPALSARGALGGAQLERLQARLKTAREHGQPVVLAIHHPPLERMTGWRKALREVRSLHALIAGTQPALVVCGHLHRNVALREGDTRVFATASASSISDASYRVFDIERTDGRQDTGRLHPRPQNPRPLNPRPLNIGMRLETIAGDGQGFDTAEETSWTIPA